MSTRNYARTTKKTSVKQIACEKGFRYPFHCISPIIPTAEMQMISRQKISVNAKKEPQVWLYYFPSTKLLKSDIHNEFFANFFPGESEKMHVQSVGNHHLTEMIGIALHDNGYDKEERKYVLKTNIISAISFRILKQGKKSGLYVFYLGTLQGVTFDEVVPMNSSMKELQCPVEGFGFASCLLRIAQMLSFNIRGKKQYFSCNKCWRAYEQIL